MNKTSVKCFKEYFQVGRRYNIEVFYTVPDFYYTRLFSCMECGDIYCADQEDIDYSEEPFDSVVSKLKCVKCSKPLAETLKPYPESFKTEDGTVESFIPCRRIPDDRESVVCEFWDLFS